MRKKETARVAEKVFVFFEPFEGKQTQAGLDLTYRVKAIEKDFTQIKGALAPLPVLWVQFWEKSSFPIAYFNCEASRNLAFKVIKNSPPLKQVLLDYDTYFKDIKISGETRRRISKKYCLQRILRTEINNLYSTYQISGLTKEEVFMGLYNKSSLTSLEITSHDLELMLNGTVSPSLDKSQLAADLSTFINVPNEIKIKGAAFFDLILNSRP